MRNRQSVAVLGAITGLLIFAEPRLAAAMEQTFDFSGYLTQQTISPGTLIPSGFQIPQTFSGSFMYDSSAAAPNVISDVLVDFGSFEIQKNTNGGGAGHTFFTPTSVAFEDTSSLGLSGLNGGLGLNGFSLTFSEPSGGTPVDPATLDFSKFPSATLNFDAGGNLPEGGDINVSGKITAVPVPEPGTLPLMAGALLAMFMVLKFRRNAPTPAARRDTIR
jgi:hypothetical protein